VVKRIAVVQSNYIPWKGYFDLINMVDEFILYDHVQYTKRDWRNRNRIKTDKGTQWITIPVIHEHTDQMICETRVVNDTWRKKHWRSLGQYYRKASFFGSYGEILEKLYLQDDETFLSQINSKFIEVIAEILGIRAKISSSVDYQLVDGRNERLVALCKQAGASEYLSGPAAKNYLDEDLFKKEGIRVIWMDYTGYPEYSQLFCQPFIHEVTIIDLLLNEGAEGARKHMLSFGEKKRVTPCSHAV
jgi:hypothetical protein